MCTTVAFSIRAAAFSCLIEYSKYGKHQKDLRPLNPKYGHSMNVLDALKANETSVITKSAFQYLIIYGILSTIGRKKIINVSFTEKMVVMVSVR